MFNSILLTLAMVIGPSFCLQETVVETKVITTYSSVCSERPREARRARRARKQCRRHHRAQRALERRCEAHRGYCMRIEACPSCK